MKRPPRWALVAAAIVVLVVVLQRVACRPRALEVEAARVERGLVEDAVTNSEAGAVRSRDRARLAPELSGRVTAIPHREGSSFRRGEVLLQLDDQPARVQLDLARREREAQRSAAAQARAQADLARREYDRASALRGQGLASEGEMDAARARRDESVALLGAAEAREASAAASVRLAESTIARLRILAPFDGVVTQRFVELGETAIPAAPALEVMNPRRLYVSAPLDEMDISRVRVGLPARITLDPFPGRAWSGRVTRVAPFVNDVVLQNRTLEIEVEMELIPGETLPKPGTSADVEVILDRRDGVLRIPTFAVIEGKRVLAIEKGKAVSKDVTIGLRNWEWTEAKDGLREGDVVVTSLDQSGVRAGAAVRAKAGTVAPRPRGARADTSGARR